MGIAVYAAAFWWVEMRLTHKAIKRWWLRGAVAAPVPLLIGYAIWSGNTPLAITTLLAHAAVVGWRFWRVWGSIDPLFVFALTTLAVGLNALLLGLVFLLF